MFLTLNGSYAELSVEQIEKMVFKIHEKRDGIKLQTLDSIKEPFMHLAVEDNESVYITPIKKDMELSLHAILNNKAYINNKWFGINEKIDGYTLKYIGKSGIVLMNENGIKKIFLSKKKRIIF